MPTRRVGLTGCCVVLRPHGCCGRRVCCPAGRAAWCAGGRRSFCFLLVAPTDLRPPHGGLQLVGVPVCCPARPRRPRGALHIGAACRCVLSGRSRRRPRAPQSGSPTCCLLPRWCSGRRMARPPARLGGLTSFVAAPRSPPVPSGPSGALHTGAACRCVLPGRSRRRPRVPQPGPLHRAGLASSGHFPHS